MIYLLTNLVNQKVYVGKHKTCGKKTQLITTYIKGTYGYIRPTTRSSRPIIRAIAKYGSENFTCKILAVPYTKISINEMERSFIQRLDSQNPEKGYNVAPGGEGGVGGPHFTGGHHSPEFKQRQSQRTKSKKWYTNGIDNVYLLPLEKVPDGYHLGRTVSWDHPIPKRVGAPGNKGKTRVVVNDKIHYE